MFMLTFSFLRFTIFHLILSIYAIILLKFSLESYYDLPSLSHDPSELTLQNLFDDAFFESIILIFPYKDLICLNFSITYFYVMVISYIFFNIFLNLFFTLFIYHTSNEILLNVFYSLRFIPFFIMLIFSFFIISKFFALHGYSVAYSNYFRPALSTSNLNTSFIFLEQNKTPSINSYYEDIPLLNFSIIFTIMLFVISTFILFMLIFSNIFKKNLDIFVNNFFVSNKSLDHNNFLLGSSGLFWSFFTKKTYVFYIVPFFLNSLLFLNFLGLNFFLSFNIFVFFIYIFTTIWTLSSFIFYYQI